MAYLDKDTFANLTVMPPEYVDALESVYPGWLDAQLEAESSWMDALLRKRYGVPFQEPVPPVIRLWLARIVTLSAYIKRGVDATDEQYQDVRTAALDAKKELQEAANGNTGLFDLPLRADTTKSGVVRAGPFGYSEQSPYVWGSGQRRIGREEDRNGGGTYG